MNYSPPNSHSWTKLPFLHSTHLLNQHLQCQYYHSPDCCMNKYKMQIPHGYKAVKPNSLRRCESTINSHHQCREWFTSKTCIRKVLMDLLLSITVSLPTSKRPICFGSTLNFSRSEATTVKLQIQRLKAKCYNNKCRKDVYCVIIQVQNTDQVQKHELNTPKKAPH